MTQIPPETDPFLDLVRGLKEALTSSDTAKADMYRSEIEADPDHIDKLVALIP